MDYTINTDHQLKLIRYKHIGNIKQEDVGKAWEELLKMDEFTKLGYNLLSDYSKGKFEGGIKDVEFICNFLFEIKHIVSGKKQAMIVTEYISTALSLLFESKVNKQVGFLVKIFSTEEAAFEWLT